MHLDRAPSDKYVCFNWRIVHGTTDDSDFDGSLSGFRTISFADTTANVPLPVSNDSDDEPDETFTFEIVSVGQSSSDSPGSCSSHSHYAIGSPSSVAVTIRNDDGAPTNSAPAFDPDADYTPEVAENTTAVITLSATDADNDEIAYSIQGGADSGKFTLTGAALAFTDAPDYETPADADTNNEYVVTVRASDGAENTDQTITVTVTNALETLTLSGAATGTEGGADVAVTAELDAPAPAGGVTVTFDTPTGTGDAGRERGLHAVGHELRHRRGRDLVQHRRDRGG